MSKCKSFVTAMLACAGALVAGAAQAHAADLQWSVTIGTPWVVFPAPMHVSPTPVFVPSAPVVVRRAPMVRPVVYRAPPRWDLDGDGIPNRHDRRYNPSWDRDGDGVPKRHDQRAWRGR